MIQCILILRIPEIPQHVLGVARKLLEIEQFIEPQLLHEPLFILLRYLYFYLVIEVQLILVVLLLLLHLLGVGKHGAGDRHAVLNGVAA